MYDGHAIVKMTGFIAILLDSASSFSSSLFYELTVCLLATRRVEQ